MFMYKSMIAYHKKLIKKSRFRIKTLVSCIRSPWNTDNPWRKEFSTNSSLQQRSQTCHTQKARLGQQWNVCFHSPPRHASVWIWACQETSMTFLSCPWPLKSKYTTETYIQGKRYTRHLKGMCFSVKRYINCESHGRSKTNMISLTKNKTRDRENQTIKTFIFCTIILKKKQ